jgi:hypothetical protein
VSRTEAGYFLDIDPVEVVPASETEVLRHAINRMIKSGNPVVPTPSRTSFPKPVILKYTKVKSWSAFEDGANVWKIVQKSGVYQISPGRKREDRGWEDDVPKIETFAPDATIDSVVLRVITLIQSHTT